MGDEVSLEEMAPPPPKVKDTKGPDDGFRGGAVGRRVPRLSPGTSVSAPTAQLSVTETRAPPGPSASAPAPAKRWLVGRGSAKRRKLEENSRLERWLVDNGVWVSSSADWGRSASGVSMAVETREQAENEVSGRGLVASRDIDLYEEIAKVPLRVLFTRDSARAKFGKECIPDGMSEYAAISLHLISEKYQEETSFWDPYLTVLPTTEDVGASFAWPDEDIETLLAGSPLQNMSVFLRSRVHAEFQALQESTLSKYPEKFPADVFTQERYVWAYAMLFSRAVRLDFEDTDDFVALVPYIDLINHQPMSQTYIQGVLDGVSLPFGISEKERMIVVRADRYYSQYEQIYISYGPKSNSQLLMLYGFSMERNNQDFLEITVGHLLDSSPMAEAKLSLLDSRKLERAAFPLYRDRFTSEMMQFMRLVALLPEDINCEESDEKRIKTALAKVDLTKPLGELPERRALLCLKGICEEMSAGYPTKLEEDEVLIQDRTMFELLPRNQRNAIRVRYGEKVILRATMATIDRAMNNLGRLTEVGQEESKIKQEMGRTFWGRLGIRKADPAIKATNLEELMKELEI